MKRSMILMFLGLLCTASRCDDAESKDRETVAEQQAQYGIVQPVPQFDWSLERDVAIQLYQARNQKVATHTVWRGGMSVIEGDCPSIGYPIPYDTSLTNPLKRTYHNGAVLEQAEPNGLYSSKNSISTWVRCITVVGGKRIEAPVYVESTVTAYPYPVIVDYETNRVVPIKNAKPTVTIKPKK